MKLIKSIPLLVIFVFISAANADPLNWDTGDWNLDNWQSGGDTEYLDTDNNGVLNRYDSDDDGDGFNDDDDEFPLDSDEWIDSDNDGTGDNADPDDDNDGYSDEYELAFGSSATDSDDVPVDSQFMSLLITIIATRDEAN